MQPLTSIHVRTEALLLTKVEVWWYLLVKLGPNLSSNFDQVGLFSVVHLSIGIFFLPFCLGKMIKECRHLQRNWCVEERRHLGVGQKQENTVQMFCFFNDTAAFQ